jgi:hypothetical protein
MQSKALSILIKIAILMIALFILDAIDFLGLNLSAAHRAYPLIFLLLAILQAAVLSWPILRARWSGWRLVVAVFLVFYAVRYFLVGLEAYYLSDLLPAELAVRLFVNGALTALIFSVLAVWIHGKLPRLLPDRERVKWPARPWWSWLWRLAISGPIYLILFIFAGLLVFQPLALALEPQVAPAYIEQFQPENPGAILLFQVLRGLTWALMTIPLILTLKGRPWITGLMVALVYALVMAPLNLVPSELPLGIRVAHTVEVFTGNFLYGWVVVWLVTPPHQQSVRSSSPGEERFN